MVDEDDKRATITVAWHNGFEQRCFAFDCQQMRDYASGAGSVDSGAYSDKVIGGYEERKGWREYRGIGYQESRWSLISPRDPMRTAVQDEVEYVRQQAPQVCPLCLPVRCHSSRSCIKVPRDQKGIRSKRTVDPRAYVQRVRLSLNNCMIRVESL